MRTLTIKIADDFTREYVVVVTDAPQDYDGFGTFSIYSFNSEVDIDGQITRGPARLVLVERDHLEWQRARYYSGMHSAIVDGVEEVFSQRDITERIYRILRGDK